MGSVRIGVLGTAVAEVDGVSHELGAARHRALLSVLAMHAGRRVATETIIRTLWGETPPAGAASTLQGYVADLRRVLEPHRAPREPARVLVTVPSGYALHVAPEAVDATRLAGAVQRAATELLILDDPLMPRLAPSARSTVAAVVDDLDDALAQWRGEPLSDLRAEIDVECERDRLRALRLEAEVLRHTALLALGRHATAVSGLERLAKANPWNERLWGLWAVGLAGSGRQAQALACLRELRTTLCDELGIDLGSELRSLETAIVRQRLPTPSLPLPGPPREPWPLVGRRHEMAVLVDALGLAERGLGQVVHLSGEPGAGKSRLTRELERMARERGFRVVRTTCSPEATEVDLWAWDRLLAGIESAAGPDAPGRADPDPHRRPLDASEDARALVSSACERSPMLIVVEDAQWADEATIRAISHLVATLADERLVFALTQRPTPAPPSRPMWGLLNACGRAHAALLELDGLDTDEVATLLTSVSDRRAHPHVAADIERRTDGNPFLVIELARDGELRAGSLPASVRAVVTHQLIGLPQPVLDLLAAASLLDRTFEAEVLADAVGIEAGTLRDVLSPAVAAGILTEEADDRYTFCQAIVREMLTAAVPPTPRARWHARVADAGEELPGPLRSA